MNAEWIDVRKQLPSSRERVLSTCGANVVIGYLDEDNCWREFDGRVSLQPTHWMPLPEPPKRESSFYEWWGQREECPMQYPGGMAVVPRLVAKAIWDAAVAASKRPDFVE